MRREVASLIVRQALALRDEGIDPKRPEREDEAVLHEAISVFRSHLAPDCSASAELDCDLVEVGYITLHEHLKRVRCEMHRARSDVGHEEQHGRRGTSRFMAHLDNGLTVFYDPSSPDLFVGELPDLVPVPLVLSSFGNEPPYRVAETDWLTVSFGDGVVSARVGSGDEEEHRAGTMDDPGRFNVRMGPAGAKIVPKEKSG